MLPVTLLRLTSLQSVKRSRITLVRAMSTTTKYDAIIVGSGQAGNPLASALAKAGKKTAVVEATHIGGCCVNDGCTPTKTLVASGRVAYISRRAKDYGIHSSGKDGEVIVDMNRVRQRKRDIVTSWHSGNVRRLESSGVDIIMGTAAFVDKKEIKVQLNSGGEASYSATQFFINTGERPSIPKLEGLEEVKQQVPDRVLDSTSIQELGEVPSSLLVLGGGYIGLEFGQLFSRLGSKVTVVQRAPRLLPREDPDITDCLREILEQDGLKVLLSTDAVKLSVSGDKSLQLVVKSKSGGESTLEGTHILLAAGRTPNTEKLALEKAGVSVNKRGYIECNDKLETTAEDIYVLGDVKGPPAFTHVSYDDFRILRDSLGLGTSHGEVTTRTVKSREGLVPYCMYTDPQLGHVGLHLSEIPEADRKQIKVAKMPMEYVARALETDESRGLMKVVVDGQTGHILGFTCLGIEGGELMSAVQIAMIGGVKYWQLQDAVFAHPAISESLNNLFGYLEDA